MFSSQILREISDNEINEWGGHLNYISTVAVSMIEKGYVDIGSGKGLKIIVEVDRLVSNEIEIDGLDL